MSKGRDDDRLKILHIIGSVNPAEGGPIEGVLRQDEATRANGLREIVSLDHPDAPYLKDYPIKVHALGRRRTTIQPFKHYGYTPDLIPWLRTNASNYDAIILNGLWSYTTWAAARVLPRGQTPYFVFTHGMMDPWFRRTYPWKHAAKQLLWLAGKGRLMSKARSVFFTCEEERLQASGEFFGFKYTETVVDYGAAAPPKLTPALDSAFRSAVPKLGERSYLLFLSRIHPKKACDLLIEGYARAGGGQSDLDLVMAGPDQTGWRPELEALALRLGVADRIHWTGPLYGDAKWGALYGADAFILPSHQENFGIAVAEALGCGTPVLISDKINIWREIDAAGAAIVEPDTLEGATSLVRRWLALPKGEREAMGERGAKLFRERYDVAAVGPALLKTIRRLLDGHR